MPNVDYDNPNSDWVNAGVVLANNRPQAVLSVWEKYKNNSVFPAETTNQKPYVIKTSDITYSNSDHYIGNNTCLECNREFTLIDKINLECSSRGNYKYCSVKCEEESIKKKPRNFNLSSDIFGFYSPCIYKITNKKTKKSYIGQTKEFFAIRWKSHFFNIQTPNCKFAKAIKKYSVTDWTFEVVEIVDIPKEVIIKSEVNKIISEREMYWICHYNSINKGYNTLAPNNTLF